MAKKRKTTITRKTSNVKMTKAEKEDLLIENFVGLQKAMTHMSLKFETLSNNLSKLLEILELSAKEHLMGQGGIETGSPEVLKQVNYLIDQNKAIAEGLLLIDNTIRTNKQPREIKEQIKALPKSPKTETRTLPQII